MEHTDRREFLASTFFAASATELPSWLAKWFAPQDPRDPAKAAQEREKQLRAAVQKAKDQGKPLLVFVMPSDTSGPETWNRGQWFGALLNHGGSPALLEVALCVPACGNLDDVRKVTGAAPVDGPPSMLVFDVSQVGVTDAPPPRVTPLVLDLGSPRGELPGIAVDEAEFAKQQKRVEETVAKLTAELRATILRHGGTLEELAAAARAKLPERERNLIAAWIEGAKVGIADEVLVQAAAEIRLRAPGCDEVLRERHLTALQAAVQREFVKKRIPGSRWASSLGCGTTIEPLAGETAPTSGVACGMGSVPPLCDRFLEFWTHG